jgi:hypothetical protein
MDLLPELDAFLFPFRKGKAACASVEIPAPEGEVWDALERIESLPEIVPVLEKAEKKIRGDGIWECLLEGRIGIWKLGYPLRIHYLMRVEPPRRMELEKYIGGIFPDVYFCHEVEPLSSQKTRLKSIYYFDLEGFAPLRIFRFAQKTPWMREIVVLSAAALMVRSFCDRWLK